MQRLAAQIQEAVFQTYIFRIVRLVEDRQRQFRRLRQDFDLLGEDFDRTGVELRIDGLRRARLDRTVDADTPFRTYTFGGRKSRRIRIGDDLGQTVMVSQIDEQQTAMVAHTVYPAGQPDGFVDMIGAQGAASMRSIAMHEAAA